MDEAAAGLGADGSGGAVRARGGRSLGISSPWCDVCARVAAAREREGEIDGEGRGLGLRTGGAAGPLGANGPA